MKTILIDAYRNSDRIALWLKTPDENIRVEREFTPCIYLDKHPRAEQWLSKNSIPLKLLTRQAYTGENREVYELPIPRISEFERVVKDIERSARFRLRLYNADIPPEQGYLSQHGLRPFSLVEYSNGELFPSNEFPAVALEQLEIEVIPHRGKPTPDVPILAILVDGKRLYGEEREMLVAFTHLFSSKDPDVIVMNEAFLMLPYLSERLALHGLECPFHRWDPTPIVHKGGKSFFSYGRVLWRDFAVRLHGRLLVSSSTMVGAECTVDGIIELASLCSVRFPEVAARSFGAAFQGALVNELLKRNMLVPFKEKPVDLPITLHQLLKLDRVGHTLDPLTGFHTHVAEIDFSSLYPWIIYNYNISPETLLSGEAPYQRIPGMPFRVSLRTKGIVPSTIKPLIDRRMQYKKNPSSVNKARIQGLKWVLVTSYGYLRFREFKLGLASSHMAIGAIARELLISAKEHAEGKGFRVVHGIIDSLYLQKDTTEEEVRAVCREIELSTGVPLSYEGMFRWIVFLPSVNDDKRPVPTRYFGVRTDGEIKARGIEVRCAGTPLLVRKFQKRALEMMAQCDTEDEIRQLAPSLCRLIPRTLSLLSAMDAEALSSSVRLSRVDYKHNIPQKKAVESLQAKGITVHPGEKIHFVYARKGVVLPDDYENDPDMERYHRLLVRSLFAILQPFGFAKKDIDRMSQRVRQTRLEEYISRMPYQS